VSIDEQLNKMEVIGNLSQAQLNSESALHCQRHATGCNGERVEKLP
jgi:hypothetical protein